MSVQIYTVHPVFQARVYFTQHSRNQGFRSSFPSVIAELSWVKGQGQTVRSARPHGPVDSAPLLRTIQHGDQRGSWRSHAPVNTLTLCSQTVEKTEHGAGEAPPPETAASLATSDGAGAPLAPKGPPTHRRPRRGRTRRRHTSRRETGPSA